MSVDVRRGPAIVLADGEIVELELGAITAAEAAERLPRVRETLAALRRFEGFLAQTIAAEMTARRQTEHRAGGVLFELKADAEWVVDDAAALWALLSDAFMQNEITRPEFDEACQQRVTFSFHHGVLNRLAKRVPEIETHRRRVEGEPRLKVKS